MTYKVELIRSEEGYAIGCPELPGCWTQGETEQEALTNVQAAIAEYLSILPTDPTSKEVRFIDVPDALIAKERSAHLLQAESFRISGAKRLGLPTEWTSHKVEDLLDILEGADRKW